MTLCKIVASTYVSPHRTHHWCGNTSLAMFWSINVVLEKQCFKKLFTTSAIATKSISTQKRLFHAVLFRCVCLQQIVSSLDWITLWKKAQSNITLFCKMDTLKCESSRRDQHVIKLGICDGWTMSDVHCHFTKRQQLMNGLKIKYSTLLKQRKAY